MEANQNITMEPYNIEYYIAKYGTVENLTNDYIGAIDGLRMQYKQYEDNPRKGGRYRREKMEHIRRQAEAIYDELLRVSRAMKDYFAAQAAEAPRISKETAETVNVSAEGEKEAQRAKNKPTFADVAQMVKTELAKNKAMRTAWHLEFPDGTECDVRYKLTAVGCDFYEYTETRNGEEAFKDYKATECDITFYICQRLGIDAIEPPQSTETPRAVECATDAPKPRETTRKPQNRGIGNTRHSGLGTGGYAMLDNASATLAAMSVPHECSTAAYW